MAAKKKKKKKKKTAAKNAKGAKRAPAKAKTKAARKPPAKKTAAKKTAAKKTAAKKTAAKKTAAKKTAATGAAKTARVADVSKVAKIGPRRTTTIVQHVFLQATPEQVFDAWVDPALSSTILGAACTGTPRAGESFTAWNNYIRGKHVELVRGERIVQEWSTTEWPKDAEPSRLELQLTGAGGGTEITMTHALVPSEQAESYRQGWIDSYWTPLRAHFGA